MYRHGEIFLQKVTELPKNAKVSKHNSYIVGHSESGHHHVLESKTKFTVHEVSDAFNYLVLDAPADLVHQKDVNTHATLTIDKGIYKVIKKQEYSPFTGLMQEVWD